jgi:hypothetical protein
MIISHKVKKEKISRTLFNTVERNLSLFMLNKRGHYFSLPVLYTDTITNFNGWFNMLEYSPGKYSRNSSGNSTEYTLYKSIENIYIEKSLSEVIHNYTSVERVYNDTIERFKLAKNGLIYE